MDIQLIIQELDKIDARSIHFPLTQGGYIRIYKELLKIKEWFLLITYNGLTQEELEDVRFRIIENTILYRRYIKECEHINFQREMGQLSLLYAGGIA